MLTALITGGDSGIGRAADWFFRQTEFVIRGGYIITMDKAAGDIKDDRQHQHQGKQDREEHQTRRYSR